MKCYNLSYFCVACIVEATHGYLYSLSVRLRLLIFTPCFMGVNKDLEEEFEDAKGIIRIRKSKKDSQHNGQKKKDKRTNSGLQNIHIKLKIE